MISDHTSISSDMNYGFPEMSGPERQKNTSACLKEAGERQIELLKIAMETRRPFEMWIVPLLKRHWYCLLTLGFDRNVFTWSDKVAEMRAGDIYFTGSLDLPTGGPLQMSVRAQHLEVWFNRYLSRTYGEGMEVEPMRRIAEEAFGVGTESANRLTEYFIKVAGAAEPSFLSEITAGIYRALCWEYISSIEDCLDGYPIRKKTVGRLVKETLRLFETVVALNRPGQANGAREYLAAGSSASLGLDDLLGTAARAHAFAAGRFNHFSSVTFAGLSKATLKTYMIREIGSNRTIRIPEAMAKAISAYRHYIAVNPEAEATLDMDERLAEAGIKMDALAFRTALETAENSATESIAVGGQDNDDAQFAAQDSDAKLSDRGESAGRIREIEESPAVIVLRRGFSKLPVLHQAVIGCLFPCGATENADTNWLANMQASGRELLKKSADRIRKGAAAPVASSILVVHA